MEQVSWVRYTGRIQKPSDRSVSACVGLPYAAWVALDVFLSFDLRKLTETSENWCEETALQSKKGEESSLLKETISGSVARRMKLRNFENQWRVLECLEDAERRAVLLDACPKEMGKEWGKWCLYTEGMLNSSSASRACPAMHGERIMSAQSCRRSCAVTHHLSFVLFPTLEWYTCYDTLCSLCPRTIKMCSIK